jgi:hypothetical protein
MGLGFCKGSFPLSAVSFQRIDIVEICPQLFQIIILVLYEFIMPVEDLLRELRVLKLLLRGAEFFFELTIR